MTNDDAIVFEALADLELGVSQPGIYDRPIGLKLLYQDPGSGAEHYLVRYPAGLGARRHRHTAAHTLVVLEGELVVNGRLVDRQVTGPVYYSLTEYGRSVLPIVDATRAWGRGHVEHFNG